jgi:uncharacterized membrane protein
MPSPARRVRSFALAERFWKDFKRFFFRGLAAVLPTVLTVAIVIYVIRLINRYVGHYINTGVMTLVKWGWRVSHWRYPFRSSPDASLETDIAAFNTFWSEQLWWVGFLLAIVGIYLLGRVIGSFMGHSFARVFNRILQRIPFIKQVYPSVKQVTDFMFSEKKIDFSRVVAVEYPRKGMYSLGLVTGVSMRTLTQAQGCEFLTVFIPSSPTPVTGYTIMVRREEVVDLPITIDEALRFTISGGVVVPSTQQFSPRELEKIKRGLIPPLQTKEKAT